MMTPVIRRDARTERIENIKFALVMILFCTFLLVAIWPSGKRLKDPNMTIPESGITGGMSKE